jgi:hypothetical protein
MQSETESMKHIRRSIMGFLLVAGVTSLPSAADSTAGFIHLTPEQVPFKHPAGLEQVILFGDPDKPGIYVVRYRFPPGMHSNPHYHSQDRQITVIKGAGIWEWVIRQNLPRRFPCLRARTRSIPRGQFIGTARDPEGRRLCR